VDPLWVWRNYMFPCFCKCTCCESLWTKVSKCSNCRCLIPCMNPASVASYCRKHGSACPCDVPAVSCQPSPCWTPRVWRKTSSILHPAPNYFPVVVFFILEALCPPNTFKLIVWDLQPTNRSWIATVILSRPSPRRRMSQIGLFRWGEIWKESHPDGLLCKPWFVEGETAF